MVVRLETILVSGAEVPWLQRESVGLYMRLLLVFITGRNLMHRFARQSHVGLPFHQSFNIINGPDAKNVDLSMRENQPMNLFAIQH